MHDLQPQGSTRMTSLKYKEVAEPSVEPTIAVSRKRRCATFRCAACRSGKQVACEGAAASAQTLLAVWIWATMGWAAAASAVDVQSGSHIYVYEGRWDIASDRAVADWPCAAGAALTLVRCRAYFGSVTSHVGRR